MAHAAQSELTAANLNRAQYLLERWAQAYRPGLGLGYPRVNVIEKARARAHGSDDPPPVPDDDPLAEQVNEVLNRMRVSGFGAPFEAVKLYYLPYEPVSWKSVGRSLGVGEAKAREWHAIALAYVIAAVDG